MGSTPFSFTRLDSPDPRTQQIIQDIYNKLNQLQGVISQLSAAPAASTSVQNTVQLAYANASLSLTPVHTDVNGASLTLAKAGSYLINGVFAMNGQGAGDVGQNGIGLLAIDGMEQEAGAAYTFLSANCVGMVSQQWTYTAGAPGKVVKLRAYKTGGTGGSLAISFGLYRTTISAIFVGP